MTVIRKILLTIVALVATFSCGYFGDKEFVGVWENKCEEEVEAMGFFNHVETLTLNDNHSFTQKYAYLDGTLTDTIATASIDGTWEINDSCLELRYNPTTITATSVIATDEPIFFNNILSKATYNNEQLQKAHDEDSSFGVKNVMVKDDKIISNGTSATDKPIEIYTRKK